MTLRRGSRALVQVVAVAILILTCVLAWAPNGSAETVAAPHLTSRLVHAHASDPAIYGDASAYTTLERGPPVLTPRSNIAAPGSAVGHAPDGASWRPDPAPAKSHSVDGLHLPWTLIDRSSVVIGTRARAAAGNSSPSGTGGVAAEGGRAAAVNGETAATALGRSMHKSWNYGPGFEKEFTLKAGGRIDAINFETRVVVELKPNNPRALRLGQSQLDDYIAKLNAQFPGAPWTGRIETYGP